MTPSQWGQIIYFKSSENWGDESKLFYPFILELDRFRAALNHPLCITCGTQGEHADDTHAEGYAADMVIIPPFEKPAFDVFVMATRFEFTEIGIYPDGKYNGVTTLRLHLAKEPDEINDRRRKYWIQRGQQVFGADLQGWKSAGLL